MLAELLGSDASVGDLARVIADRAAGNPFFAEEMVRELVQRAVLRGTRGDYVCHANVAEVNVPATVQAAIASRIDRLNADAKQTLNAASVIGARFGAELVAALDIDAVFDELLSAELIDQVRFTPRAEYAFRHPLIRAVAYESQLKSGRAEWHRRLAAAIQESAPALVEDNAALIAEHLQAAGELLAAYGWHMRAGAWSTNRDVGAARVSWERSARIADALPAGDTNRLSMRIAPRTMLCATDWLGRSVEETRGHFAELRDLCTEAGDKLSLAVGMSGLATELLYVGRSREGSRLATEQMALLASIGDPALTIGLAFIAFANWFASGQFDEILRLSQTAIDLAEGDPTKGAGFGLGCPLAVAMAFRGVARYWLGRPGWRQDLHDAVAMARHDAATLGIVVTWTYGGAILVGALRADDVLLRAIEEALESARRASSDIGLIFAEYSLGSTLLCRDTASDRDRGLELMVKAREWQLGRMPLLVPLTELIAGRERARRGESDAVLPVMRTAVDELYPEQIGYFIWGTGALVETLLARGTEGDLAEAQEAIDRLADRQAERASAMGEITLLRLRALQAGACGDRAAHRDLVARYRAMSESLGFDGHIEWAAAMSATF